MVQWFVKFFFHKYYHRLSGRSLQYWTTGSNNINDLRSAGYDYVCYDKNGTRLAGMKNVTVDNFRIFGWIDCMMMMTCRPGGGPDTASN